MPRPAYIITVVDRLPAWRWRYATAKALAATGVPLPGAAQWQRVRRAMGPKGLARQAWERRQ